jgi:hypothetical protein
MGYAAICPEDVVTGRRALTAGCRTLHPGEEYRCLSPASGTSSSATSRIVAAHCVHNDRLAGRAISI